MKTMTYLDIILWIQENVFEIYEDLRKQYVIEYYDLGVERCKQKGTTLIECVLKANNAELILDKPLDLTPRTSEEQIKALMYVKELKVERINSGNNQ